MSLGGALSIGGAGFDSSRWDDALTASFTEHSGATVVPLFGSVAANFHTGAHDKAAAVGAGLGFRGWALAFVHTDPVGAALKIAGAGAAVAALQDAGEGQKEPKGEGDESMEAWIVHGPVSSKFSPTNVRESV